MIAILRRCRRCYQWRSIENFKPLGRLCQQCVLGRRHTDRRSLVRAIVVTPNGLSLVRQMAEPT